MKQEYDGRIFNFWQMFNSTISGKTDPGIFCAFIAFITGILGFIATLVCALVTKDVMTRSQYITILSICFGVTTMGGTIIFGHKVADSKEVLADINSAIPNNSVTSTVKSLITSVETQVGDKKKEDA